MNKPVFQKYNARMKAEAMVQSGLIGVAVGGGASMVAALCCMFGNADLALTLALTICIGVGVAAICGILLYVCKYKPTERQMADRADSAGLEERALTMLEYENDSSYIAERQRADATEHIQNAAAGVLATFAISIAALISAIAFFVAGSGMTVVSALMAAEVIPPIVTEQPPLVPEGYAAVSYLVEEGGEISGEEEQLVLLGESAEPVTAVPDEGWAFSEWSDGVTDPYRYDVNVTEDFTVTAIFEEVEGDGDGNDGDSDNNNDDSDSDDDSQKPNEDQNNDSENPPPDQEQPEDPDADDPQNPQDSRYEEKNQIINGETYYRDVDYYKAVMEKLTSDTELTEEEREFIEKYFAGI